MIEIFLPLRRNDGSAQPPALFGEVRGELVERFGGLTAFTRSPADGLWDSGEGEVEGDAIVIFEVMAEEVDRGWWADYRAALERRFEQEKVVVRASATQLL